MGEEVRMSEYGGDDDERVLEWEDGLPNVDDLTPLSQPLIPPELASAFSISPVQFRSALDVDRASQNTLSAIRGRADWTSSNNFKSFNNNNNNTEIEEEEDEFEEENDNSNKDPMVVEETDVRGEASDSRSKMKRVENTVIDEEVGSMEEQEQSGRSSKRARLVWTPQLHKRFVEVVSHLGISNAVPKTIMQLMNVEGLTRENVASHLQKYRLYLRRMSGGSDPPPPAAASQESSGGNNNSNNNGHVAVQVYPAQPMMQMPIYGGGTGMGMGMGMVNYHGHGYETGGHHNHYSNNYGNMMMQQSNWSSGNNFGSVGSYPHAASNDN